MSLWLGMASFTLLGAITPGPVNLLAMRLGLMPTAATPLAFVLGASASYAAVVALMGLGASQVLQEPSLVRAARWLGAAYMANLAWRIASAPVGTGDAASAPMPSISSRRAFFDGCLTQWLNPKAWLVALSGVSLFVLPQADAAQALRAFGGISLGACFVGVGCWALAGRLLTRWLESVDRQRFFNRALGVALSITLFSMLL